MIAPHEPRAKVSPVCRDFARPGQVYFGHRWTWPSYIDFAYCERCLAAVKVWDDADNVRVRA